MTEAPLHRRDAALISAVVVIATALGIFATATKVNDLQANVAALQGQVQQLVEVRAEISTLHRRLAAVSTEVGDITKARDEIIGAICHILGRRPSRCGLSSLPSPP